MKRKPVSHLQLGFAAALIAINALSSNVKPQEITTLVQQGVALAQVVAAAGPTGR
jgi:hypothetical protein